MILNEVRPSVKSPSHSFNDDIIPYTSRARMFNSCGIRYLPRYLGRHTVNVEKYVSGMNASRKPFVFSVNIYLPRLVRSRHVGM